ncbi:MAG: NAD-dependent epimerase/dehydratase family protein [Ruminococcus sp.]|nr:NAD-dependent epimerase/dehydratase family protein [Ruminococcus sp.]
MRKILITGGTVFVSRFTAEYFVANGDEVYVLNRGSREQAQGVTLIQADRFSLTDELREMEFDAVLDICAYSADHVNALLDALGTFGDYILLSSGAVYPDDAAQPVREDAPTGENAFWGDYGVHKRAAEEALLRRVPDAYILRPPYLYGPYENLYRAPFLFDCALADRKIYIPESDRGIQFLHVRDLCRLMDALLTEHPEEHILNAAHPQAISFRDWAAMCCEAAGKEPVMVRVDDNFPVRAYFPFPPCDYILDTAKMTAILPELTPLDEGIRQEFAWYTASESPEINRHDYIAYIDSEFGESARKN